MSRMLRGVCVNRHPVSLREGNVAVLAREHFAIYRPATGRGFHVKVSRSFHFRKEPTATNAPVQVHFSLQGTDRNLPEIKCKLQINPRLRKSPMFPPLDRSIMSMVNLSRQTSQASSTPWMTTLRGNLASSTRRLVRLMTEPIVSRSVSSVTSVLRNRS